jgi:hypothetical protein
MGDRQATALGPDSKKRRPSVNAARAQAQARRGRFPETTRAWIKMMKKPISADSHITEPQHCYVDYIDPKFRDRAPRMERLDKIGDAFVIEGLASPMPTGPVVAAGKDPLQITARGAFAAARMAGWRSG